MKLMLRKYCYDKQKDRDEGVALVLLQQYIGLNGHDMMPVFFLCKTSRVTMIWIVPNILYYPEIAQNFSKKTVKYFQPMKVLNFCLFLTTAQARPQSNT